MHPERLKHPDARFVFVGDKKLKQLQRMASDAGWWPVRKKDGVMWLAPNRLDRVMVHATPSDHRASANTVARFRVVTPDSSC